MMKKNILILGCKNYPAFSSKKVISGGMEVYVSELIKYLKEYYNITIISGNSINNGDVNVVSVPLFGGFVLQPILLLFFSFFLSFKFRKKIDLINAQSPLSGLISFFFKKLFGISYVVTVHIFASTKEHTGSSLLARIYNLIEKIVILDADKLICAGYKLREHLVSKYRLKYDHVVVIHPGMEVDDEKNENSNNSKLAKLLDSNNSFKVLFLGRLIKENGIMDLLKAMKYLKNKPVKLLIAGNGDLRNTIRRYVQEEELQEKVELLGIVSGKDKKVLLRNIDLMVRTSYHEVFPVVYLEALAFGLPVIATSVGDTEFLAKKTGAIEIVPLNAPKKVADAISKQINAGGLRLDIISTCKAYIQGVSWRIQAEKTACLFDEILDRERSK